MNAMTTTSHGRHGSLRDETATVKSAALVLRQKQLDERASSCKSYISYVRTGVWINNIWASEDTWLALVQMALIRLFMIWPLKLIAPSSFAFAAWRFTSLFFSAGASSQAPIEIIKNRSTEFVNGGTSRRSETTLFFLDDLGGILFLVLSLEASPAASASQATYQ